MALFPAVGRKQLHMRISWWLVVFVLCFGIFMHLIPVYFMITTSFKPGSEVVSVPPTVWPHQFTLQAWRVAFQLLDTKITAFDTNVTLVSFFWNSLFMAGMVILISTPITALAAYASSKLLRGPLARWIFLFFIGTMLVPGVITLVPTFLLVVHFPYAVTNVPDSYPQISLLDTPWAVIIPALFNVMGFFYFKAFFDTIPDSIIQAARVDGGAELNIFRRIVLPMSVPVFAIVIAAQFGSIWDSYLWPSLAITSKSKQPLSVAIYNLIQQFTALGSTNSNTALMRGQANNLLQMGLSWNGILVLGILQSIPTFLFFLLCFRYLLSGIRIRGLK